MYKNRATHLLITLCGILLLIIFLLPYGIAQGATRDLKNVYTSYEWVLSIFITLTMAWLAGFLFPKEISIPQYFNSKFRAIILIPLTLLLSQYLGYYCFDFRPHLIDSIVQIWQAKTFAAGQVYSTYQGQISFFLSQLMLFDEGKMYGQYPPGNAIFLTLNFLLKLPNVSGILLGFISLLCTYRFSKRVYSQQVAVVNLILFLFSGFFLFNNQSFMNHVPGLAFAALFMDYYSLWKEQQKKEYLALIGIALGLVFICRPLEGTFLTFYFTLANIGNFLYFKNKNVFKNIIIFALTFLSVASIYFIFNYYTTGDMLLSGYIKLWGSGHNLGFHESPWGEQHTLLKGLEGFYINLKLLNEFLFESPIPPLSLLGLYFLQSKIKLTEWDKRLSLLSIAIPFIYIFYWHRDSFLGPRYTYIALAFFMPLFSNALCSLYQICTGLYFPKSSKYIRSISLRNIFVFSMFFSLIFIVFVGLPMRAKIYASSFYSMKTSLHKELETQNISQAIVFVKVSWGTRIIASLRELKVPASLIEKAYRSVDHCDLWNKIQEYENHLTPLVQIEKELTDLMDLKQVLNKIPLNQDPSLRLKSVDDLDPQCQEQIDYDLQGYTIYEPHLLENKVNFLAPLIVARDMRMENKELAKIFPEIKEYYLWTPGSLEKISL